MGWEVEERRRYALIEQDSEDSQKHRATFFISARHVKHHFTKQFVEFSYVSAPNFASQENCKAFAQNSHCAIEVYDKYAILFDPDYERKICVEHWTPQVKISDEWQNIDLASAIFSGEELSDGIKITRRNDVFQGENKVGELQISWILRTGALLKHEIILTNLTSSTKTLRIVQTLIGIAGKRVIHVLGEEDVTVTEKEKLSRFIRFVDKDKPAFQYLHENLLSLGHTEDEEWVNDKLRGIRFKLVDYEDKKLVRCDIVIGNYLLAENESLLIDPDSDTWQVAASADDFSIYGAQVFSNTDGYMRIGHSGTSDLYCGARFTDITIPKAATITSAYLKLTARLAGSDTIVNTNIEGEAADNADQIADYADWYDIYLNHRTSASVAWDNIPAWSVNEYGDDTFSPDIKTIIQEIVNRDGWSSGNAINIFVDNDGSTISAGRYGWSYDGSSSKAPKLEVTWTSGVTAYTKTWQTDVLFKKLGTTKTTIIDIAFKKPDITRIFGLDSAFAKATQIQRQVNILLKKLDISEQFGADVGFLKRDITRSFAIDTCFGAVVTYTIQKQIDALFKKLDITKGFAIDVDLQKTQQVQRQINALFRKSFVTQKQVDALFKKLGIQKTFAIDAYIGAVAAQTYTKTMSTDVIFRYKVKLPPILGITLDGQLVIPLKKEVWVES